MNILIIGGNRFFGRHLVGELLQVGHSVTLLNRGQMQDHFGDKVQRLKADRGDETAMATVLKNRMWDLVYDQVCYTAAEARLACRLFGGKAKRYVVASSQSIYDYGLDQKESIFDPDTFEFTKEADRYEDYQSAKRQVEAVFTREAQFEVALVRLSLVVGTDDYTERLQWHIDRIRAGLPMYLPFLEMQSDFIRSDQAGQALKVIGLSKHEGPINCTSSGSMSLKSLISICETAVGKKGVLIGNEEPDTHSPYGGTADKTMNTQLLQSLGFKAPISSEWMEELVRALANKNRQR